MPSTVSKPFHFWRHCNSVRTKTQVSRRSRDSVYDSACSSKAQFLLTCLQAFALMTDKETRRQWCARVQDPLALAACIQILHKELLPGFRRTLKYQLKFCMLLENFPSCSL